MEMRSYDEIYLSDAQNILGHAFDFALVTLGYPIEDLSEKIIQSNLVRQFEIGNPKYVTGMNGCEFLKAIYEESGILIEHEDEMYLDKSPEYWAGWILAYYQWYSAKTFREIEKARIMIIAPVIHVGISKLVFKAAAIEFACVILPINYQRFLFAKSSFASKDAIRYS